MLAEEIISRLQIVETEKLKQHEETIPYNFQKLREAMLNMGRLVDPIIVERKHYIVIDGNHRKRVLDTIKCPNAACQIIDYESDSIKVGSWFPVSKAIQPAEIAGFKPEAVDFETGIRELEALNGTFMYVKKNNGKRICFLYNSTERKLSSVISHQRAFMASLNGQGVQYIADDRVEEYLDAGYAAFYRRLYTKREIVEETLAGRLMPPKSTRHMVPDRIIRLNLHLGWLAEPADVCKQMMDEMLRRRLNEGSIRRYTEPVIVLY
ncbi:MAG: hypothetical protein N3E51_03355 [Candidatus Micrarchaeota archaeon]|nr:hypothetical protein [Candidatus Micrarchaeota archaeon]